jgi:hypothetical protein
MVAGSRGRVTGQRRCACSITHSFVRSNFLAWAQDNDPEAVAVFEMGDKTEEPLFPAGSVAA